MEKEYVYWLKSTRCYLFGSPEARSISIWAKSPTDGLVKLASYQAAGYTVKYLYSLDDFKDPEFHKAAKKKKQTTV